MSCGSSVAASKADAVDAVTLALEARGIVKRFGAVVALNGVDLAVRRGEIHALLGENGAGKTTLINIAAGLFRADAGTMAIDGQVVDVRNPREAVQLGFGVVHQQFSLVDNMTVAENVHLGWEAAPRILRRSEVERRTAELAERYGLDVDPSAPVWRLSVGEMQRVAILRTLARGARIVVLDEPTAVLTPQESERLFDNLRAMTREGRTVVFISHKLREVMAIADRVTVLRGGRRVATMAIDQCDEQSLVVQMVGRELAGGAQPEPRPPGPPVLVAEGVSAKDDRGLRALHDIDLTVGGGEIVGVASVAGNGSRELAEVLSGMRPRTGGTIGVDAVDPGRDNARGFIRRGVGHIPEHYRVGLALGTTVEMNAVMKAVHDRTAGHGPIVSWRRLRGLAAEILDAASLGAVSVRRRAATLSGGQAQRMVIQRELRASRRALIAAYPTRGLDVAATRGVHEALLEARRVGVGVVLLSEDLEELFRLSDRLVVLYEGRIVATLPRDRYDLQHVGLLMAGGQP